MIQAMTLGHDTRPWYKERWPWILMAGPAVVIVAGVITVYYAVTSNDGLVTDDYYKQGLAVNQRLQRDREASQLGLHADLMRADQHLRLLVNATAEVSLPPSLSVRLAHPTRAGQDQLVQMTAEGQGLYVGKLAGELGGRWRVTVEDPAGQWRLQGEWLSDRDEPLQLTAKQAQ